jgi:hypothetical protein
LTVFGDRVFGDGAFESQHYIASWEKTYSFDFLAGVTVSVLLSLLMTKPLSGCIELSASEDGEAWTEIEPNVTTPVIFVSTESGSTNLHVCVKLCTTEFGAIFKVHSLGILIHQETSLYTIATQILDDGLTPSRSTWLIDTELQKYLIPYGWVDPQSHRSAIGKVAEAAGGVAFQDRYGVVRVQAGNYLERTSGGAPVAVIGDRIYDESAPATPVKNRIQVQTYPLVALAEETVWELVDDKIINDGETKRYDITYTNYNAVINGHASLLSSPSGATISSEIHYSWGAVVEVLGSADEQELTLAILAQPLSVVGSQLVERTDGESIRRNGDKALLIKDNKMIQRSFLAGQIADAILPTTAQEKRDIDMDWRGDPTLEMGDKVLKGTVEAVIVANRIKFNGALRQPSTLLRKV